MRIATLSTAALGAALLLALAGASPSFAKGHNQGATSDPGSNVGQETVVNSQQEGAMQGQGKTAAEAGGNLGKSGDAGRDTNAGNKR